MSNMPESNTKVPDATSLAERLRWLRDFKELTLRSFAERVDCDPAYLSKLENGKAKNPSVRFTGAVAVAFRTNPEWLRTGKGDPFWSASSDKNTKNALPDWSDKRFARIFSILDELPDALAINAVLECLFRDHSLEEFQEIWHKVMAISGLPATARLFWNDVYLRFQITKMDAELRRKMDLTESSLKSKTSGVKSELEKLVARVKRLASRPGAKADLARFLDVAPARVTEWLNDDPEMRKEPGGNYTLALLKWVGQQERQK